MFGHTIRMSGYTYGIEGVSKNSDAANFVINQGSDASPLVSGTAVALQGSSTVDISSAVINLSAPVVNATTRMNVATLYAESIFLRGGVAVVGAAAAAVADFNTAYFLDAFPSGSYCYVEFGDGAGSSVTGFFSVGAAGALSALQQTQGALLAPVTAATLSIATSVLSVTFTGKVASTNGIVRLTRCSV